MFSKSETAESRPKGSREEAGRPAALGGGGRGKIFRSAMARPVLQIKKP